MIKFDERYGIFKYYNENDEHEFIDNLTCDETAEIIFNLILCPKFKCDSTITNALCMAMRKLQGYSDKDI